MSDEPSQFPEGADLHRTRPRRTVDNRIDRLPPHSMEAEQGVLGCILLDPPTTLGICVPKMKQGEAYFYDLRHQTIYETLAKMHDERTPIDIVTVQQRLKDANQLDMVGGIAYISNLPELAPTAANLEHYLAIVLDKAVLRKMISTCTDFVGRALEHQGEMDELVDQVETEILAISEDRNAKKRNHSAKELALEAISQIEHYHYNQGVITGLATGLADLDKILDGLHAQEMIVIAARPSLGKTALAMSIVEHVTVELKLPVGVFSLEMSGKALMLRMVCSQARVNLRHVRDGFLTERDFPKISAAAGRMAAAPLHIDDTAGLSIMQLRAKARRMHQQYGIKLLVVDYMQLLHSTNRKSNNRQEEIADISGGLKNLAKELDIPVVVLSQLNREVEKREGKPKLSDIRESGAVEQDADVVAMLYRDKVSEADEAEMAGADSEPLNVLIAKQRNGPCGDVRLTFLKGCTRFENCAKVYSQDIPQNLPL